ncbi:MAG: response regulator [Thermodesulfobacteriota bacterium]
MEKKCSILIVDDDSGMTDTLTDVFDEMGYTVAVAEDGFAAIDKIKRELYDVALMDIKMPRMNGVETFKEIKKINPSMKVIMMTAYAMEELIKEALREGALDVIHKPLDIDKVVSFLP